MLRFPATQGTILVQCPVCSHRFQFSQNTEDSSSFEREELQHHLPFQPSFKAYLQLCADILYAPIDYLKSKTKAKDQKIQWIPIFLFSILFLYIWSFSRFESVKPSLNQPTPPNTERDNSKNLEKPNGDGIEGMDEMPETAPDKKSLSPTFEI
ncbi:MAG: hypothetical protein O9301_07175 [Leptospira sp.]|nr:hypothetical protein [Leptospira sp.]